MRDRKTKIEDLSQNQKTDEILSVLIEIRDLLETRLKKPLDVSELFRR
jgi:hypothetical protein